MSLIDDHSFDNVELLCETFSLGTSSGRNIKPHRLPSTVDHIQQCQIILDTPHPTYEQKLASYNLDQLVTQGWNNFGTDQKLELEIYVLDLLTMKAQKYDDVVINNLKRLAKRLTRLNSTDNSGIIGDPSSNEASTPHPTNFPIFDQEHPEFSIISAVPGFLGVAILDMQGISIDMDGIISIEFKLSSE